MKKLFLLSLLFTAVLSKTFAQSGCPAITGFRVSNITNTSASFDWDPGPFDFYAIEYKISSSTVWTWFGGGTAPHQDMSVFSPGTTYDIRLSGQYAFGGCAPSAFITFTTTGSAPPPVPYCTTKGSSTTYGWIKSVQIAGINNNSGNNSGYANFTNLIANITGNTAVPITVQAGASKTPRTQQWTIFVDLNNDGDFADAGETVSTFVTIAGEITTQNIIVPTTLTGNHRMRIKMVYYLYAPAGPCGTFAYGEAEDYTLNIAAPVAPAVNVAKQDIATAELLTNNSDLLIYPNPTSDYLKISYKKGTISNLKIYDIGGRMVIEKVSLSDNKSLNISQLQRGSYLVALTTDTGVITQKLIKN